MEQGTLISIIIPVYNSESYLEKCIDSVLAQTYENIEVILVDDGSTDMSPIICDKYVQIDERVVVIHQPNQGQADARNNGIMSSRGQYLSFIDSDDFVEPDYIEYLWDLLNESGASISICGYAFHYENRSNKMPTNETLRHYLSGEQALEELLYQKHFDAAPWAKLIDANIVKSNLFPRGRIFEDFAVIPKWLLSAQKVIYGNAQKLFYLVRSNGTMNRSFTLQRLDLIWATNLVFDLVLNECPELVKAMKVRRFSNYCQALLTLPVTEPTLKSVEKEIIGTLKSDSLLVIADRNSRIKNKVAAIIIALFGANGLRAASRKWLSEIISI